METCNQKKRKDRSPNQTGCEAEPDRTGPKAQEITGGIETDRQADENEDPCRGRHWFGELAEKRVEDCPGGHTEIDAKTAAAYGQGGPLNGEAPFRELMANRGEGRIDQCRSDRRFVYEERGSEEGGVP